MKKEYIIPYIVLVFLAGCVTHEEVEHRSYQDSSDPVFQNPTSLQYAERIEENRYRIYNVFEMPNGSIREIGNIVLSKDEPIDFTGEDSGVIDSVTITLIEFHDHEIIVRSEYSSSDLGNRTSIDSIPLRDSPTKPPGADNPGKRARIVEKPLD